LTTFLSQPAYGLAQAFSSLPADGKNPQTNQKDATELSLRDYLPALLLPQIFEKQQI